MKIFKLKNFQEIFNKNYENDTESTRHSERETDFDDVEYYESPAETNDDKTEREVKEKKPRKSFKVGDVLMLVDDKQKKLPQEAYDFLMTYGRFDVLEVNEKGNLYLGFDRNGEKFYFSPNRFDLRVDNNIKDDFIVLDEY